MTSSPEVVTALGAISVGLSGNLGADSLDTEATVPDAFSGNFDEDAVALALAGVSHFGLGAADDMTTVPL